MCPGLSIAFAALGYCFWLGIQHLPKADAAFVLDYVFCPELLTLSWAIAFALSHWLCTCLIWHSPWADTAFALGYDCLCMGSCCLCPGLVLWPWAIDCIYHGLWPLPCAVSFAVGCCFCRGLLLLPSCTGAIAFAFGFSLCHVSLPELLPCLSY